MIGWVKAPRPPDAAHTFDEPRSPPGPPERTVQSGPSRTDTDDRTLG